jgi:hypothetical protein
MRFLQQAYKAVKACQGVNIYKAVKAYFTVKASAIWTSLLGRRGHEKARGLKSIPGEIDLRKHTLTYIVIYHVHMYIIDLRQLRSYGS